MSPQSCVPSYEMSKVKGSIHDMGDGAADKTLHEIKGF